MPGLLPVPGDFLEARVLCQAANQLSENVLHYRVVSTAVAGGLSLQDIATGLGLRLVAPYRAWMPVTASFNAVFVQNLTAPRTNPLESIGAFGAGTALGVLVPRQASALIKKETSLGGHANRGRMYIGFIASSSITPASELDGGGLALLVGIAEAVGPLIVLLIGASGVTLQLVVRHPDLPGPPRVPQGVDVSSLQPQILIATQKRRGDYGKGNF